MRRAFSLLEVCIALSIFTVVMGAVLQSLISVRMYTNQDEMRNDLVLEGRRIIDTMVQDLGNSAWYIPIDCDENNEPRIPFGTDKDELDKLSNGTGVVDRDLRYYPYVQVQSPSGRGNRFQAWNPPNRTDLLDPATLPPSLPDEHRLAPSQEIIFLKVRTAPAQLDPSAVHPLRVDFNAPLPTIAQYTSARTGIVTPGLTLTASSGVLNDVPLAWESHLADPEGASGPAYIGNPKPDFLREWGYVVAPNPNNGKGRLIRRYRNGTGPVQDDRVISEQVDRMVVDTYRTAKSLNVNQVRITLYLSKAQDGFGYQTHRVQVTAAMRSTVDPEYTLNLGDWLGTEGKHTVPAN